MTTLDEYESRALRKLLEALADLPADDVPPSRDMLFLLGDGSTIGLLAKLRRPELTCPPPATRQPFQAKSRDAMPLSLFHVQDSDRPVFVLADGFGAAHLAYRELIAAENEIGLHEVDPADGVNYLAAGDEVLLPWPRAPIAENFAQLVAWWPDARSDAHEPGYAVLRCALSGRCLATVWRSGTWHSWNADAVGGENDSAHSPLAAMQAAELAVIRQRFDTPTGYRETGVEDDADEEPTP